MIVMLMIGLGFALLVGLLVIAMGQLGATMRAADGADEIVADLPDERHLRDAA